MGVFPSYVEIAAFDHRALPSMGMIAACRLAVFGGIPRGPAMSPWVRLGKARAEQNESALPPTTDTSADSAGSLRRADFVAKVEIEQP